MAQVFNKSRFTVHVRPTFGAEIPIIGKLVTVLALNFDEIKGIPFDEDITCDYATSERYVNDNTLDGDTAITENIDSRGTIKIPVYKTNSKAFSIFQDVQKLLDNYKLRENTFFVTPLFEVTIRNKATRKTVLTVENAGLQRTNYANTNKSSLTFIGKVIQAPEYLDILIT